MAIREGFDRIANTVPGMEGMGRSEAVVLNATIEYIQQQKRERESLVRMAREKGGRVEDVGLKVTGESGDGNGWTGQ